MWNFTKDRKQTLAGLFHDIATPVFKHCIDFMNGDYEKQESTEELTYKIIKGSFDLDEIKNIYQNIEIQKNENGIDELGFKCKETAEEFVNIAVTLQTEEYVSNRTKLSMQFLADIMKRMCQKGYITKNDLYRYTEKQVIELIENCEDKKISECFKKWKNCTEIQESDEKVQNKYCQSINGKLRYVNPLVKYNNGYERIGIISEKAKEKLDYCINFKTIKYAYFNFDF